LLFGYKSRKRRTRIMVTLPDQAAEELSFVNGLVKLGMNSARINCAHGDAEKWGRMIENIKKANILLRKKCKIVMDLAGPKLRTGAMQPGPEVIKIKPKKNNLGEVTEPAKIWIAAPGVMPEKHLPENVLHVDELWLKKIKRGNTIHFKDTRGKSRVITIEKKKKDGAWGTCHNTAYLASGTTLELKKVKQSGKEVSRLSGLLPTERVILLHPGDTLILHKEPRPGQEAMEDENGEVLQPAHISCTLPEIFKDVKAGEPIYFDDGKMEGIIKSVSDEELLIEITHTKSKGGKLRADKGINLPESDLQISGLTEKDRADLPFVAANADAINFSFVNTAKDVEDLLTALEELEAQSGIILKIETRKGYRNLPEILLKAMQTYPIGVLIARGDLAIETGWKNFAGIQEEILRVCEAAHVPDVWATQVLETLAKKGVPTRAEITDSAMAQRAQCVMLNKGPYIENTIKMLDKILRRAQNFQKKMERPLPPLSEAGFLKLSYAGMDKEGAMEV
jgi:pyruvate kinase